MFLPAPPPPAVLSGAPASHLLAVLLGAAVVMTLLWALSLRLRNAALVDLGWAALLGLSALGLAAFGTGPGGRRLLLAVLVGAWSLRLTLHLFFTRIRGQEEEGRYQRLRAHWGRRADLYFLPFFLGQAVLVALLSIPFLLAAHAPAPFPHLLDIAAAALWLVALGGEALADHQLRRFRAAAANRGRTCREGLWRWSRHPNYFFEWLVWLAFALLALLAPAGAAGLLAPALMLLFVLKLTGIPPTEAQALRTRGNDYRDYQQTTSAFFPWPPRKEPDR